MGDLWQTEAVQVFVPAGAVEQVFVPVEAAVWVEAAVRAFEPVEAAAWVEAVGAVV